MKLVGVPWLLASYLVLLSQSEITTVQEVSTFHIKLFNTILPGYIHNKRL
jgi:hypothetical protein